MKPLQELLSLRESSSMAEVMGRLEEGLSRNAAESGAGAAAHQMMLDYFKLNERACNSSFRSAFKKFPSTADALQTLCIANDLTIVAQLMQSLRDGSAKPLGVFKDALVTQAEAIKGTPDKAGVLTALQGFAKAALASPNSEAEMELSLCWDAVEDCLLDQLAPHADVIAFDWGPLERKKREQSRTVHSALMQTPAVEMLIAFFTDPHPQILAKASEWDVKNEGASGDEVAVTVCHVGPQGALPSSWVQALSEYEPASQLLAVYQQINGAALFCTDRNDLWSAGIVLLPADQWDEARGEVIDWLTAVDFQEDPTQLPGWVRSAIAFGKIPGDASYWLLPVDGPFAGKVLLSNDDVSAESFRYPSFDAFIATLRLHPQLIVGSGGYIRYNSPDEKFPIFPDGYRAGQ
jgi:hypothetical protein